MKYFSSLRTSARLVIYLLNRVMSDIERVTEVLSRRLVHHILLMTVNLTENTLEH